MVNLLPEIEAFFLGCKELGIDAATKGLATLLETFNGLAQSGDAFAGTILANLQVVGHDLATGESTGGPNHEVLASIVKHLRDIHTAVAESAIHIGGVLARLGSVIRWTTYAATAYKAYRIIQARRQQLDVGVLTFAELQRNLPFVTETLASAPSRAAALLLRVRSTVAESRANHLTGVDSIIRVFFYDQDRHAHRVIWDHVLELIQLGVDGSDHLLEGGHVSSSMDEAFRVAEVNAPARTEKSSTFTCLVIHDDKGPMDPKVRQLPPFQVGPRVYEQGFAIFGTSTQPSLSFSLNLESTVTQYGRVAVPLVDNVCHRFLRDVRWHGVGRGRGVPGAIEHWGAAGAAGGAVSEAGLIAATTNHTGWIWALSHKYVAVKFGMAACTGVGGLMAAGVAFTYDQVDRHWWPQYHETQALCARCGPCRQARGVAGQ